MLIGEEERPRLNVEGGTLNADSDRLAVILNPSVNQADDISLSLAQVNRLRSRYQFPAPEPAPAKEKPEPPLSILPPS